ncbi:MAG TPA: type II toxin-antitoxin system RelE/ParE family toxin [Rhizomicrobium sp.]|jgi:plasmid stabilization system protein ParE|nr:type II toxin-antitoxin system RelE/ParE family toxin [Rhizomicrobium sp.]
MTFRLTTTKRADDDIRAIARYIFADNAIAAGRFTGEIWQAFRLIAEQPDIGRAVTGFEALRAIRVSARFRRYHVIYRRLDHETVEVVRIWHSARDIARLFE